MSLNFISGCTSSLRLQAESNALYEPLIKFNSIMYDDNDLY